MGHQLRQSIGSVRFHSHAPDRPRRRGLLTTMGLITLSVGVYSVVTALPAAASVPVLTAPERVYMSVNQPIDFANVTDKISDDNHTISIDNVLNGPPSCDTAQSNNYSITGCPRVQLSLNTSVVNPAGLLALPHTTTTFNQQTVIIGTSGSIIDQATDPMGGPSLVFHINGTEAQIDDTLNTLQFVPTTNYENHSGAPVNLNITAVDGLTSSVTQKTVEIEVLGTNDAPTGTVPMAPINAPTNQEVSYPADPSDPATPPIASVIDPEMCTLDVCGLPYTNPGGSESDDAMLLVAWVDSDCGTFHFRGGAFYPTGNVTNTTVLKLLTNQPQGLGLAGEQAAPILNSLGLQGSTVDLQSQPSNPTDAMQDFAGVGSLDDVRYALSQITYKGPMDDKVCPLNIAVSDLGNSGMPALHGYVGSPIGGIDQPQPGYEIPDAKGATGTITFDVHDTHPDVTVEQTHVGPSGDPTNQPVDFTATFSEQVDHLDASDLDFSGSTAGIPVPGAIDISPLGMPSTSYDISFTPTSDGVVTLAIPAGKVNATADPKDNNDASTSTDNSITFDHTPPTPAIVAQTASTSTSPVLFNVDFGEDVIGFGPGDVDLSASTAGVLSAFVTPVDAQHYTIAVTGMSINLGSVTAAITGSGVTDLAGNASNPSSTPVSTTWNQPADDGIPPTVTVTKAAGQTPNTSQAHVFFDVVLSEPVAVFDASKVTIGGTANPTTKVVTGGPLHYSVDVTGMTNTGTVTASVAAASLTDSDGHTNIAGSSDSVNWVKPVAGAATHLSVTAPASVPNGAPFTVTVTALDSSDLTATSYVGTIHFTSSDGAAVLHADAVLTNGVGQFTTTLPTVDPAATVTATDTAVGTITGAAVVNVTSGAVPIADTLLVSMGATATAGASSNVTVTAVDSTKANAIDTSYSGIVHFTSTDGTATLPVNTMLVNGTATLGVTFQKSGSQTVTAKDSVTSSIAGTTGSITVAPAAATHLVVTGPGAAINGSPINVSVTAKDQFNNTATSYAGIVSITSTDGAATLPVNAGLVNGVGSFQVTLATNGIQKVTATDAASPSVTGFLANINVTTAPPGAATHFNVTTVGSAIAGAAKVVTVTALASNNTTSTSYAGTVHFTSTDASAVLPPNATLVNGVGTFNVTFKTAGGQTITATDTVNGSINGTSTTINVAPAAAKNLSVTAPANATIGSPISVVVTAKDPFGNTATAYAGVVHFTSTNVTATLPTNYTFIAGDAGSHVFSTVVLGTAASSTVTVTDVNVGTITGTTGTISVSNVPPPVATHFAVTSNASVTAGTALSVTVTALDAGNAATTGYAGTVHFTSTDGAAVLPANAVLVNGVGVFNVTLKTAGSQNVVATDTLDATINGTRSAVAVSAAATTHLTVTIPASTIIGTPINAAVTAKDAYGNTVTNYLGMVHLTSSDGAALLPVNNTLSNGTRSFSVTLDTLGSRTVTATDTVAPSITGFGSTIVTNVPPPVATHLAVSAPSTASAGTAFSITVTALDAANATVPSYVGTVHFSSSSSGTLPVDATLTNGVGVFNVTLNNAGNATVTATDTVSASIAGTSAAVSIAAGPAIKFVISIPVLLPVTSFHPNTRQIEALGQQYSFTVSAVDQFGNIAAGYAGTVHFTSDDPAASLPPDSKLSSGFGMFTATFSTPGSHTISVADLANPSITGGSVSGVVVNVDPSAASTTQPTTLPTMPSAGGLPATGTDSEGLLWAAAMLMLSGGVILVLRSRRRPSNGTGG